MNKIQVVIGEQDEQFLVHLVNMMENGFKDSIDARCFSRPEHFLKYLHNNGGDVILVDEKFGVNAQELGTGQCGYLCDSNDIHAVNGCKVVGKYQHPDEIYKQIMDIHLNGGLVPAKEPAAPCEVVLLQGFSGGTGVSTVAAAASMYSAGSGTRTFYLNLEDMGSAQDFFHAQGTAGLDDILDALKSDPDSLSGRVAEYALTDSGSGVSFFLSTASAAAMAALTEGDWMEILGALRRSGAYGRIFVDCGFALDGRHLAMMEAADKIAVVTDGSEPANTKFYRAFAALSPASQPEHPSLTAKMVLLYNAFSSSKSSRRLENLNLPVVGTIPPVKHALVAEIIQVMLSRQNIFERLLHL